MEEILQSSSLSIQTQPCRSTMSNPGQISQARPRLPVSDPPVLTGPFQAPVDARKLWKMYHRYVLPQRLAVDTLSTTLRWTDKSGDGAARSTREWCQLFAGGLTSQDWGAQLSSLERKLHASKAAWKIVIGHHPPRSNGHHGNTVELLGSLEPIMQVCFWCQALERLGLVCTAHISACCSRLTKTEHARKHILRAVAVPVRCPAGDVGMKPTLLIYLLGVR